MSKPVILVTCYTTSKEYASKNEPGTTFKAHYANLQRGRSIQLVEGGMLGDPDNTVAAMVARSVAAVRLTQTDRSTAEGEIAAALVAKLNDEFGEKFDVQVEVTNHRDLPLAAATA